MTPSQTKLVKGAVKTGLASLGGLTAGVNWLAPQTFSIHNWSGIGHTLLLGAIVIGASELRYIGQWLSDWANSPDTPDKP